MQRKLKIALSVVMIMAIISGCSSASSVSAPAAASSTVVPGGSSVAVAPAPVYKEIKVALEADLASTDPRNANSTVTASFINHIFSKLVSSAPDMSPTLDLAERYEQIDDLTWRFYLRKDVTFHDGSPFTSADVVFTFDSIANKDKKWRLTTDFSFMKAKAIDEHTVDISTEKPYPGLLLRLNYVSILPKAYVEKVGDEEFAKAPIGSGPYKYIERAKDEFVIIEAYDKYFKGKPAIDKITFRIIPEAAARLAALEAGEVLFIPAVPSVEKARLDSSNSLSIVSYPTSRVAFLNFNHYLEGPLKDIRVRQAINYAIDRDKLINGVLDGYANKIASLSCPEYDGFDPSVKGFGYDLEKAKKLLAEAGYPNGFAMTASYSQSTANSSDIMQFIAAQLGSIGIKVELREMEATQHRDMIAAHTSEPLYMNAIGGPYANIDLIAKLVFSTGERYSTYTNPDFDALREKAATTVDKAERDKLNAQLQQFVVDDAAAVTLYQPSAIYGVNKKLVGWVPRADELKLFFDCDIV